MSKYKEYAKLIQNHIDKKIYFGVSCNYTHFDLLAKPCKETYEKLTQDIIIRHVTDGQGYEAFVDSMGIPYNKRSLEVLSKTIASRIERMNREITRFLMWEEKVDQMIKDYK